MTLEEPRTRSRGFLARQRSRHHRTGGARSGGHRRVTPFWASGRRNTVSTPRDPLGTIYLAGDYALDVALPGRHHCWFSTDSRRADAEHKRPTTRPGGRAGLGAFRWIP
ncbi:hypothetical protein NFA_34070 [Nocardia farcinica IFM 10152]|uniref:Uncharacterized protein n=1 Tax=Nocardia farcinica (strain IFM 10152) TaxID=247156 RepID=Q5YU87_NOCFA|nr:hypothetical protein NFA_34070 [Nocardia farcinica IFM 10152]